MDANELMFLSIIASLKLQPQKIFPREYKTRARQDSISKTFTQFSRQNIFHSLAQIIFLIPRMDCFPQVKTSAAASIHSALKVHN